jgi:UDP-GlcNAc:undecaprenyl-phosphate/decaprenyl-phosphate GlcNAc-1-phosphate transferase
MHHGLFWGGRQLSSGMNILVSGLLAFAISWLIHPHFRSLGFLTDIVDRPGYRRPHNETVPRTGGMAIFISFFVTLLLIDRFVSINPMPWSWLAILGGAGLAILALGVGDDRFHIHAEKKLYGQLVVIIGLMLAGERLDAVNLPVLGQIELGGWAWPVSLLWYLGFINSMNLIDGLDGLASGIGVIASLCIVVIALAVSDFYSALYASTLCGATLAFMYWNMGKRKIFLGDSGSMWMGLVMAILLLHINKQNNVGFFLLLAPMIAPIWDTGTTIVRRYRRRASIFEADDYHLHHRLIRLGFRSKTTVYFLLLLTLGSTLIALSDFVSIPWLGLPALGCWLAMLFLWTAKRKTVSNAVKLDFFSELKFVMGFDDGASAPTSEHSQVAEIIDLQVEREKVERVMAATSGSGPVDIADK